MPVVDVNAVRGMRVRSSTNCSAGTLTARSVARVPTISTSPRTHTGFPQARRIFPGAVSMPTRRKSDCSHWSPQTFRLTSTTSSYATATPRSVYETVNARVWSRALKYQTMRTVSPRRSTPNVPGWPGSRLVWLPRANATPRSATDGFTSDSPRGAGCRDSRRRSRPRTDLEALAHAERAVGLDVDRDIGLEQREAVGAERPRNGERDCRRSGDAASD